MSDIHPIELKTKTAKKQYYQSLLKKGHCESLKTIRPNDYKDYQMLFKHHPNKGKIQGMTDLVIRPNYEFPNSNQMFIIYDDGREEASISYRTVLEPKRVNYWINEAMRNAIHYQIVKFRQSARSDCEECGSRENLHVDHYDTPFSKLRDDFLNYWTKEKEEPIPEWFAKNNAGSPVFNRSIDNHCNFECDWAQFHEYFAKLRMLCRSCNCSHGDYGYKKNKISLAKELK